MAKLRGGDEARKILRQFMEMARDPFVLRVGFLENATYPDGKPVAMIGAIQNYGAPRAGIPPRPFFSNMIRKKQGEWPSAIVTLMRDNDMDIERVLTIAGAAIAEQLKQSIIDTNTPPLADSTVARKGFDKPLIDTSHMINSVDFEVKRP